MTRTVDYCCWGGEDDLLEWPLGETLRLDPRNPGESLLEWAQSSTAEYGLLWLPSYPIPESDVIERITTDGVDAAHLGLRQGLQYLLPDLDLIIHNWSMIPASADSKTTSWRLGIETCLLRRSLVVDLAGLDEAYQNLACAGLDFGYRCFRSGALVEHRPDLAPAAPPITNDEPSASDLYAFVTRHYGRSWARYVLGRRLLYSSRWDREWQALEEAQMRVERYPAPHQSTVWYGRPIHKNDVSSDAQVSVVIPTLGRYAYLPRALTSLRRQTIRPKEVIVVDQNPEPVRQPEIYDAYKDLNVRVIWQDALGQSLARNTALASVSTKYVVFFDDDSEARHDLIEAHLSSLTDGRFSVSTGISVSPSPPNTSTPEAARHPRISVTFDTGNSLIPTSLAKKYGGLDRNYDFGRGTDTDFGTRLYLGGERILHNPYAIRVHHKAPIGGLREFGAVGTNTDAGLLEPFPPVTLSYYGMRYLTPRQRRERILLKLYTEKFPRGMRGGRRFEPEKLRSALRFVGTCLLLPLKFARSYRQAQVHLNRGVRLAEWTTDTEKAGASTSVEEPA